MSLDRFDFLRDAQTISENGTDLSPILEGHHKTRVKSSTGFLAKINGERYELLVPGVCAQDALVVVWEDVLGAVRVIAHAV